MQDMHDLTSARDMKMQDMKITNMLPPSFAKFTASATSVQDVISQVSHVIGYRLYHSQHHNVRLVDGHSFIMASCQFRISKVTSEKTAD